MKEKLRPISQPLGNPFASKIADKIILIKNQKFFKELHYNATGNLTGNLTLAKANACVEETYKICITPEKNNRLLMRLD